MRKNHATYVYKNVKATPFDFARPKLWILRDHLRERILQEPRFFLEEIFLLSSTKKCFPPEKILDPAKADRAS